MCKRWNCSFSLLTWIHNRSNVSQKHSAALLWYDAIAVAFPLVINIQHQFYFGWLVIYLEQDCKWMCVFIGERYCLFSFSVIGNGMSIFFSTFFIRVWNGNRKIKYYQMLQSHTSHVCVWCVDGLLFNYFLPISWGRIAMWWNMVIFFSSHDEKMRRAQSHPKIAIDGTKKYISKWIFTFSIMMYKISVI